MIYCSYNIIQTLLIEDMDNEAQKVFIPKIKKTQLMNKILFDPGNLKKGLPQTQLPELTDRGMILSLTAQKTPLAKLSPDGMLKLQVKYNAETIELLDKYIEVQVSDNFGQFWVGNLFGITVRGTKGEGNIRGCKVLKIEGQTIIAEAISDGSLGIWKKFQSKVNEILKKKSS